MIKLKMREIWICEILTIILIFSLISSFALAYHQAPTPDNKYTHQYITNESFYLLNNVPIEIKLHLINNLNADPNGEVSFEDPFYVGLKNCIKHSARYSSGDDIIIGSGEEDNTLSTCIAAFSNHYWQPDSPIILTDYNTGQSPYYNEGLLNPGSSFQKALDYWKTKVIPNYLQEDKETRNGDRNEELF